MNHTLIRRLRLVSINFVVFFGLVCVIAGSIESYERITFKPESDSQAERYADDPQLNHAFSRNFSKEISPHASVAKYRFQTNEIGLRFSEPYTMEKPPLTRRIVVCGDSFVEGFEWATTIPARLQVHLEPLLARVGQRLEVIHAGVGSYSPMLHYFAIKSKLLQLDPDAVIMAIDMTDAYDDAVRYRPLLQTDGNGEPIGVRSEIAQRKESLREAMAKELPATNLDRWVARLAPSSYWARRLYRERVLGYMQKYPKLTRSFSVQNPYQLPMYDADDPTTRDWIQYSQQWVLRTADLLRARGVPFMIELYPYQAQLLNPNFHKYFSVYAEFAKAHNILFHSSVLAFAEYQTSGRTDELFLSENTHYNYAGQRVWSDSLNAFVEAHISELLPGVVTPPPPN